MTRYQLIAAASLLAASGAAAVPTCTHLGYGAVSSQKPNKLYLYFPPTTDATFPEFGADGAITSPAHKFDVAELTSYTGTSADLQGAITDVVTDDYCEFNVEVIATTTSPPATFAHRDVVAIGTDSFALGGGNLFGQAENVDTGDTTAFDHARVWGGTYQVTAGGAGGALNGANSTLDRWARSIGGTSAHEGGHNYGLSHTDGLVVHAGEDAQTRHVMAKGNHFTDEQRAGYRRHFSDTEYEILAANVGLSVQTMWNWDFVNPNAQTARTLRMTFLSTQTSLSIAGPYTGNLSPWSAPTVSASLGTQTFKGTSYHRYQVTWSTGQAWNGGTAGQVGGGGTFHVGTGFVGVDFNTPDPIIITQVDLIDASNAVLALHPRLVDFDSGTLDAADGTLGIDVINADAAPIQIDNVSVQLFARQLGIEALLAGAPPTDIFGLRLRPTGERRVELRQRVLKRGESTRLIVAKLSDKRQYVQIVDRATCADRADRTDGGRDTRGCRTGMTVSLFPATSVLVSATITDPAAKHWDKRRRAYVVGPLTTHVFMQIAGRHPDLDHNGVDDYIDIAMKKARDSNGDGVIDGVKGGYRAPGRR